MFNHDFYPTPKSVIGCMLAPYSGRLSDMTILEPSAGRGDILDSIVQTIECGSHWRYAGDKAKSSLYAFELNPDLSSTLRGKGYRILGDDFLQGNGGGMDFDLIIMNPPFSDCERHFLHAWEILKDGDLVCILPESVFENPYSEQRKLIQKILVDNKGSTEHLGRAFHDAERKTDVSVCLTKVAKKGKGILDNLFSGKDFCNKSVDNSLSDIDGITNGLIKADAIDAFVDTYEATAREFQEAFKAVARLSYYGKVFGNHMGETNYNGEKGFRSVQEAFCQLLEKFRFGTDSEKKGYRNISNDFMDELRRAAWNTICEKTKLDHLMTSSVKTEFRKFQKEQGSVEFSSKNIHKLLDTLMASTVQIGEGAIIEAFDLITKYHAENRLHVEGWKTNDSWKVNRKFILPNVIDYSFGSPKLKYNAGNDLGNIDRGLCFATGKVYRSIQKTTVVLEDACKAKKALVQSEFFDIRYFRKGTAHFTFRDTDVWEKFNTIACKGKKWLPE